VLEQALFRLLPDKPTTEKFDEFIAWASPYGTAGVNHIHAPPYLPDAPYFDWTKSFFGDKDKTKRTYLWTWESNNLGAHHPKKLIQRIDVLGSAGGQLIRPSRFLRMAKAYLNITVYYRNIGSRPGALICAISFLEKSLRLLNDSNNDPTNLCSRTFERAQTLLEESHFSGGVKYDTGRQLEIMAGMLQHGYHSKNFHFSGKGFRLLAQPFSFTSRISQPARVRHIQLNSSDLNRMPRERLTSEKVAALGLAYRKSLALFGPSALPTVMAALAGLALTTVSMRVSDLLTLRRDAIYRKEGEAARLRIRLSRPKIGTSQDLPLSKNLSALAEEMVELLLAYTAAPHKAFAFYLSTFGDDFSAINELYVPENFREILSKSFLTFPEVFAALGIRVPKNGTGTLPQRLDKIPRHHYVVGPGDIWNPNSDAIYKTTYFLCIGDVESYCLLNGLKSDFPSDLGRGLFVSAATADKLIRGRRKNVLRQHLAILFTSGQESIKAVKTTDLKAWLLDQFKSKSLFPHWPYVTKDRNTRFDDALFVRFTTDIDPVSSQGEAATVWWMPTLIVAANISHWITAASAQMPPLLFRAVDVRLKDGSFPSFTLHEIRRYYHTAALLAGAHEVFVDELAGRNSGRQSDHYDMRSPHEILASSIDTFDPESSFVVAGPVADFSFTLNYMDRQSFLYKNAAPKHITEIGGCATDWSLEPCKQYGDCMRCDQHLWRKGDVERLAEIDSRMKYAESMVLVAENKLLQYESPPRSLLLQQQQFKDDIVRCEAILAVERNSTIATGDIVTFAAPTRVTSTHELTAKLAVAAQRKKITREN
jgi:hypothetical protein